MKITTDRLGLIGGVTLGVILLAAGLCFIWPDHRFSLVLGFSIGLLSFPGMLYIYDYGLGSDSTRATGAMGLSFFYKGAILLGSLMIVRRVTTISFTHYVFPLFFTVFFLGFFAIYLARQESDISNYNN